MRDALRIAGIVAGMCVLTAVLALACVIWGVSVVAAALTTLWGGAG